MSAPAAGLAASAPTPITGATNPNAVKIESSSQGGPVKVESGAGDKKGPGPQNQGPNSNNNMNNNNRGGKRRRGGPGGGPMGNMGGGGGGRGGFGGGGGGRGGGQGGGVDRRSFGSQNQNQGGMGHGHGGGGMGGGHGMGMGGHGGHDNSFDGGPSMKKPKISGIDGRVLERLRQICGPTVDLPPRKFEVKKFLANTRLYIGNLPNEVSEPEIKDLFLQYGEVDEVFINRDKNFAFLKLDYRTSAERARAELDQRHIRNRPIKVRFAPATVRVKVKNLSPMVSNELLEMAFSIFGDIERALVFVDDKGKSLGEGFVDFTRKNNAVQAHKICSDKCFFLTADLRPVLTEMGDMCEVDEGLLEMNLPKREFTKGREIEYYQQRGVGPRFAEEGSFDDQFGQKWKKVLQEHKDKETALKNELDKELEKIQAEMEIQKYEFETEMLRQQLKQRELDHERQKLEWENRMQRMPRGGGGGPGYGGGGGGGFMNGGPGGPPGQGPPLMDTNPDMCGPGGPGDMGMGPGGPGGMPGMNDYEPYSDMGMRGMGGGNNGPPGGMAPLPPPPMPPQGLMAHLGDPQGPTWEIGPFGPSFGGDGGNFGNNNFGGPPAGGPPFGGGGGGGRGGGMMGPGPRGQQGHRGGGGGGQFRGGNRGGRR